MNGYKPFKVFYFKADYLNDTLVQKTMERASCQRTICSMAAGIGRGRAGSRAGIQETAEEAASSVRFSMSQVGDEVIEKGTGGVAKGTGKKTIENGKDYSTRIDNQVEEIEKMPLPSSISTTFKDANYRTVIIKEDIAVYRAFVGHADAGGTFATTSPVVNRIQTKIRGTMKP
ncbi:hypothetical protein HNQ85_002633 [Anoxybacillus calidus]|uniref:Uncharacterized protein n=1 Tax=[Anoxybacillus] calidus TaxID=575178 RepID=A0A7V9Z1D9_9BACL|nr:hypothetical protein [Anoxybacillus calidus]MBA2872324.1 hypothetical protein [Anoxybacillus calidus]